jgi:hypothetical protein
MKESSKYVELDVHKGMIAASWTRPVILRIGVFGE